MLVRLLDWLDCHNRNRKIREYLQSTINRPDK